MKDYAEFKDEMNLRDYLSCERTKLALNRTFLSYVRTAIGLFASGIGLVILQDQRLVSILGILLIILAIAILIFGAIYCGRLRKKLKDLQ